MVLEIDNRKIAKVARLAGAPNSASAGVDFLSPIGKKIEKGDILYTVHSDSEGELEYAFEYMNSQENIIVIS